MPHAKRQLTPSGTELPEDTVPSTPLHPAMPSVERVQQELTMSTSIEGIFGKEGIVARLFASTIEQMLDAELTAHLDSESCAPEERNSGNSRNGSRARRLRMSTGDQTIQVSRDRNSTTPYQTSTSEIEDNIIALYA